MVLLDDDGQPVRLALRHLTTDPLSAGSAVTYVALSGADGLCLSPDRARALVAAVDALLGQA